MANVCDHEGGERLPSRLSYQLQEERHGHQGLPMLAGIHAAVLLPAQRMLIGVQVFIQIERATQRE